jgi:hypothetical protein
MKSRIITLLFSVLLSFTAFSQGVTLTGGGTICFPATPTVSATITPTQAFPNLWTTTAAVNFSVTYNSVPALGGTWDVTNFTAPIALIGLVPPVVTYTPVPSDALLGPVTVTVTITKTGGGGLGSVPNLTARTSGPITITINAAPIVTVPDVNICGGLRPVSLTSSATGGSGVYINQTWAAGDGVFTDATVFNTTYTPGLFDSANRVVPLSVFVNDANGCSAFGYGTLFLTTPANAGFDQNNCNTLQAILPGNDPTGFETVLWTYLGSTPPGAPVPVWVLPNTQAVTEVAGLAYGYTYDFDYTITGFTNCSDVVQITPWQLPSPSYAGPDQNICFNTNPTTITLAATSPAIGTGHWIQAAGAPAAIANPLLNNTTVDIIASGPYAFQWIVENGSCSPNIDNVDIYVWAPPVVTSTFPIPDVEQCRFDITAPLNVTVAGDITDINWYSTGDGFFDNSFVATTIYNMGTADTSLPNQEVIVSIDIDGHAPCASITEFVRIFVDETNPTVITQNITVDLSATPAAGGTVTILATDVDNVSNDLPCTGVLTYALDKYTFTCADLGNNTVTLTVTDDNRNSASNTATVYVQDVTDPTAICKDITVDLDHSGNASIVPGAVDNGSWDNCSFTLTSVTPSAFTCANVGANTVTLLVTDQSGNTNTCTSTVTVRDVTPPDLTCHNITVNLSALPASGGTVTIVEGDVITSDFDACGIATRVLDRTTFTCADVTWPNTPITLTLTVTDVNGNSTVCNPTITVRDVTNPTAVCQDITVDLDHSGAASIVPSEVDNGSWDNCDVTLTSVTPSTFDCSNVGPNTVTLLVTDPSTNSNTCTSTVTIRDLVPPDLTCQNITVNLSAGPPAGGTVTIVATDVIASDFDACGIATRTLSVYTFTCADIFAPVDVTVTVTDVNGNSSVCHAFVTVKDITAPTITACPSDIFENTFPANPGICGALVTYAPITWTDNCTASSALVAGQNSGTIFPVGITTVVWEVTDLSGNVSTCTFDVTVTDNEPPLIICPPAIVDVADPGVCYATIIISDPFVSDNCPGPFTIWSTCPTTPDFTDPIEFPVGNHIVTWHATDAHGNSSSCTQSITVNDVEPPTIITCPANRTIALDATSPCEVTVPAISMSTITDVWDNCGILNITQFPTAGTELASAHGMTHTVTMIVHDIHGNSSTCNVTLTAQDMTNPTAVCKNITVNLDATGNASIVPADVDNGSYDNCVFSLISVTPSAFTCSNTGAPVPVTLLVRDANNNSSTCVANVTVKDVTAPVIVCKNITVDLNTAGTASIVGDDVLTSATDACGIATKVPTPSTFSCADVSLSPVSVNVVVTDVNGNTSVCTALVVVRDVTPPAITCQNITVNLDANGNTSIVADDVLSAASDACGIATKVVTPSAFTCASVATSPNTVTVVVTDVNGNSSVCTATVTVRDVTAPSITCKNITVNLDGSGNASIAATDVLLSATDACGIATRVATPNTFTCADIATSPRPVVVVVTDVNGNSSTCTAYVTVLDLIPPVVTCPASTTVCSVPDASLHYAPLTGLAPTITDNCSWTYTYAATGATVRAGTGTADGNFNVGVTHVVYTVTDQGGNVVTCAFDVTVYQYQQATAGPDLDYCNAYNSLLLGNIYDPSLFPYVVPVTYTWTQVPVPGTPTALIYQVENEAIADALVPGHVYKFEFTMSYGPCISKDTMTIFNWAPPTPALAGFDQDLCGAATVTMAANTPVVGQGTWIQNSGPAVTIAPAMLHNPSAVFTLPASPVAVQYGFVWQIVNGMCPPENDEVLVTNYAPVVVNAGPASLICPNAPYFQFTGASASNYSTLLWQSTGTGYFDNVTAVNPKYYPSTSDVNAGTVTLTLYANGQYPCGPNNSSMVLTINDFVNPTITCPANVTVNADAGMCYATAVALGTPVTADNCLVASVNNNHPVQYPVGLTTVTWTVADGKGNTATCNQTVTVVDNQFPVITCPANVTANTTAGVCTAPKSVAGTATATDNCPGVVVTSNAPTLFPKGTTTVIWTATDAYSHVSTCSQTVTVVDAELPVIACPANVTVNTNAGVCTAAATSFALGTATATDNCTTVTVTNNAPITYPLGVTNVTWTATDGSSNTAVCTQTVTVVDNQAPILTCPTSLTVNTDAGVCTTSATSFVLGTATATDNCPGTITIVSNAPTSYPKGVTTVTWTATDANGLVSTCNQTVTVVDNQNPTVVCHSNITVNTDLNQCSALVSGIAPTVADNCPGVVYSYQISGATTASASGPFSSYTFNKGTSTVLFTATDASGRTATCSFTVLVKDMQAPTLTCPPNAIYPNTTGICGAIGLILTPPTVVDNCSTPTAITVTNNAPYFYIYGNNYVTWTATDQAGNSISCVQVVEVIDTQVPTVNCPANITVNVNPGQTFASNVSIGTATASDNCWLVGNVTNNHTSTTYPLGVTQVTWSAMDQTFLNVGTCVQTVTVINPAYPGIVCPGNQVRGTTLNDCGAIVTNINPVSVSGTNTTYTYALTGATTGTATGSASGVFFNKGVTTVTYTASNAFGPTVTCSFTVTVNDVQAPTVACPANVTVSTDASACSATNPVIGTATATDNCPGVLVTSNKPSVFPKGLTTVIWTATDAAGLTSTCAQSVTVADLVAPTITCPANVTANTGTNICTASGVTLGAAIASDNCPGTITLTNNGIISGVYPKGTTNVTWTATDFAGNTATCVQTVTVLDNQNPVITCPASVTVNASAGLCTAPQSVMGTATATDNCPGVVVTNNAPALFPKGTTTVIWTATDASSRTATCTQTVTVNDIQVPTITCPANVTVNVNPGQCVATNVNLGTATYGDNCTGATLAFTAPTSYPIGVTSIVYTVTDAGGRTATCAQTVTVVDNQAPWFTNTPANVTVNADAGLCTASGVNLGIANGDDLCSPIVTIVNNGTLTYAVGTTTVTYTASDAAGNTVTYQQTVTVVDNQIPVITCPANLTVSTPFGQNYVQNVSLGTATANDNCGIASIVRDIPLSYQFPIGNTTVIWVATDTHGMTATCAQTVTVIPGVAPAASVSGRLSYINSENTAMHNEPIVLATETGDVVSTTTTDDQGDFIFTDVPAGSYTIHSAPTAPWGGSNATDALIIMKHFTQVLTLVDLEKEAADVNSNEFINSLDALYVAKRFVNQISSFPSGDWASHNSTVVVGSEGVTQDLGVICYGDVNASYIPNYLKPAPTVNLSTEGVKYISANESIELPVYTNSDLNAGAISLVINYPANLFDVTGVKVADMEAGNLVYNAQNGELRIAWYNSIPSIFNSNEAVAYISLKAKSTTEGQVALSVDGSSEIANGTGVVETANLTIPKLAFSNANFNVNVYPNPFKQSTEFTYTLPVEGNVSLKVYDMVGNVVSNIINGVEQAANTYKVSFDGSNLKQGVYTYKLTVTSASGDQVKVGRMVITK